MKPKVLYRTRKVKKNHNVVKVSQYQFLIKPDGIVGPLTWKFLHANAPVDKPTLRRGSTGELVSIVQQVLKNDERDGGFDTRAIDIDGNFGEKIKAAVKAFQKIQELVVDGIIGNKTWVALSELATFLTTD